MEHLNDVCEGLHVLLSQTKLLSYNELQLRIKIRIKKIYLRIVFHDFFNSPYLCPALYLIFFNQTYVFPLHYFQTGTHAH